jgi:uncharacterized protein
MLSKTEIEQKLKILKPILNQKYHVKRIGYFGSFANGNANETSDIDILVDFDSPIGWEFFDIQDLLFEHLKRKIDLVSIKALKKQLKDSILKQVIFI